MSEEGAADDGSDAAPSDSSASFETDSELEDDPLGEYDDVDDDLYEQRRHKYMRGQCHTPQVVGLLPMCLCVLTCLSLFKAVFCVFICVICEQGTTANIICWPSSPAKDFSCFGRCCHVS